jgi:hypothetical protein
MNYVYILFLLDGEHVKIGVTEGDLKRIISHHNTYGIDIDKIRIIRCSNRNISLKVEKYLLNNIPSIKRKLYKKDGFTELRNAKVFQKNIDKIMGDIDKCLEFSYLESKSLDKKLYSIYEFADIVKRNGLDVTEQLKSLSNLDYKKYTTIFDNKHYF